MRRGVLHEASQADQEGGGVCGHRGGLGLAPQAVAGGPITGECLHTLAVLPTAWHSTGTARMELRLELRLNVSESCRCPSDEHSPGILASRDDHGERCLQLLRTSGDAVSKDLAEVNVSRGREGPGPGVDGGHGGRGIRH